MKPKILIADDDADLRAMLGVALGQDYQVVEAEDGLEALSEFIVGEGPIDLVVTDLNMPGMDGVELAENLPEQTQCIIISGYLGTPEYQDGLRRLHPAAVLSKPFQLSELLESVKACLSGQ